MDTARGETTHRLSKQALSFLDRVTAWVNQLPAGAVEVTQEIFPPDDDYGSELLITFRPQKPQACALTVGIIPDTSFLFHFHLGELEKIAEAEGITLSWTAPAQVPLFLEPRLELSQDEMFLICQAVAEAQVTLNLGIIGGILFATRGSVKLPSEIRPLALHGVGGPMALVKVAHWFGCGEVRSFKFEPWA
jgi:hypothetical protein